LPVGPFTISFISFSIVSVNIFESLPSKLLFLLKYDPVCFFRLNFCGVTEWF
jgi:hypothetical protein